MIRTVALLLIACFCANVSSRDDCIVDAIQILREQYSNNGDKSQKTPSTDGSVEWQTTTSDVRSDVSSSDDLGRFERLYLDLKQYYEIELRKLEDENNLLKRSSSQSKGTHTEIHTIKTFCTCNVTDRRSDNDCSDFQTTTYLDKVQDIQKQLAEINEKIGSSESNNGRCCGRAHSESQEGERPVDWKQLPGSAVEISANGKELWVINSAQNIYRWNGSGWELKPGSAVRVGSSPDGWTWVVNRGDNIYRWNVVKGSWDLMPGGLVQISALSKEIALGVNRVHGIYLWSNNAWTKLPGAATWAGIGDGDERWVVNSNQVIFRWNHQAKNWNQMPGKAVNVDVQNPCRVIVTNAMNQIFIWKNNNWQIINGAGTRASINGTHYYTVNSAQQLFIGN